VSTAPGTWRTPLPGFSRVVFLSHVNEPGMPLFPGDPAFGLGTAASLAADGFFLQEVHIGEQSGTHWAAPAHFNAGEASADELPAGHLIRPAVVLDVRAASAADADFELGLADIERFELDLGLIPGDALVVMWTAFDARWGDAKSYLNAAADGTLHFPGFSLEAAEWLIAERDIGGLGVDTLGVDPGRDEEFRVNSALLRDGRIHIENLTGLEQMPPTGGWIVVGGMRNLHGSGGPATVFGLVP
jgi:kynurenine formamidase